MRLPNEPSYKVYEKVTSLVEKAFKTNDYSYIEKAAELCSDESGVWMYLAEDYTMVDDDVYYHNGHFL